MEVSGSTNYDWDNLYLNSFLLVVSHYGHSEGLVYVVYVGDGV